MIKSLCFYSDLCGRPVRFYHNLLCQQAMRTSRDFCRSKPAISKENKIATGCMREQIAMSCMREQIVIKDWEWADGLDSLLSTDRERVAEKKCRLQVKET